MKLASHALPLPGMAAASLNYSMPVIEPIDSLEEIRNNNQVESRLRSIDWSFSKDDTDYLSHDIHPYPTKFIPQIPANLITALSLPGEIVWDPFGGSGTTAFEALLLGRQAISTDANPLATLISQAKCSTLSPEDLGHLQKLSSRLRALASNRQDAEKILKEAWQQISHLVPEIPNIEKWFHIRTIQELAYLKSQISSLPNETCKVFASVCLSGIIVKVSFQDGETRYASKPRDVDVGETLLSFSNYLSDALKKHEPLQLLLQYRRPIITTLDIREPFRKGRLGPVYSNSVDLVITSPPYANATDNHLYHRFRLFWLGYRPTEFANMEIGSHLRHQRLKRGFDLYAEEMSLALRNIYEALQPGRFAVLIVGDSLFDGKIIHTSEELANISEQIGFEIVTDIERPIHQSKRSFIVGARRARQENILVLRKPPRKIRVVLYPASYKMWDYEVVLRKREIVGLLKTAPEDEGDGRYSLELDPFEVDRIRRLTFTHKAKFNPGSLILTWQAILENGNTLKAKKNRKEPKYVTHGIHPYKGKFYPQLAKSLFNLSGVPTNSWVLDPFCGSGTVLLEAQLNGLHAAGIDMHPLAVLIARAKTSICQENPYEVDFVLKDFLDEIEVDRSSPQHAEWFPPKCHEEIRSWFPPPVVQKLGWLLMEIKKVPILAVQEALLVCLSSIIRNVSQQDPKDLRIRRRNPPITDAPVLELFRQKVLELRARMRQFAESVTAAPYVMKPARVIEGDSRTEEAYAKIAPMNGFDLVVTSPPYATALPYIDTDRLNLLVILGMSSSERSSLERKLTGSREIRARERRQLEEEIPSLTIETVGSQLAIATIQEIWHRNVNAMVKVGFRRRNMGALLLRYFRDMFNSFRAMDKYLARDAQVFIVIGDNKTVAGNTIMRIPTTDILVEQGEAVGWALKERIPITVTKENLRHSKHSITKNTVLWFYKDSSRQAYPHHRG